MEGVLADDRSIWRCGHSIDGLLPGQREPLCWNLHPVHNARRKLRPLPRDSGRRDSRAGETTILYQGRLVLVAPPSTPVLAVVIFVFFVFLIIVVPF